MRCKIALYGFGSFPVVYRHLIELARAEQSDVAFCMILTGPTHRKVAREVLSQAEILDVFVELPREPVGGDSTLLAGYRGSLVEDLAAVKFARRWRSGGWRLAQGFDTYRLYKQFLIDRQATHLLMTQVETPDAKIAVAAAQELGVKVIAPVDLRNLTGTYFSTDSYETPPAYAAVTAEGRARAVEFLQAFRHQVSPARQLPSDVVHDARDDDILDPCLPPFPVRAVNFLRDAIERLDLFDHEALRVAVMRNFGFIRAPIRGLRRWRNARQYDVGDMRSLPRKFVYFPLQYTPESSINVPAPYFVDQFRVIDALRFAMPSDHLLVVKEHPTCLEMRPPAFTRRLRSTPGVVVANATLPSIELIRHASVTATVTGTAAFEAFLLGYPAVVLGRGLSSWSLGGLSSIGDLRTSLETAMAKPLPDEFIIDQVARLISVRYPFYFGTPYVAGEPMLRRGNIRRFWAALLDHMARERVAQASTPAVRSSAR